MSKYKTESRIVRVLLRESPITKQTAHRAVCLIIGLEAEIEGLEKRLEEEKHALFKQQAYTAELQAEIERLYKSLNLTAQEQYTNGRNDGIKEFEEKLKEKAFYVQESEWDGYVVNCNDIIEFAKEMTEEQK